MVVLPTTSPARELLHPRRPITLSGTSSLPAVVVASTALYSLYVPMTSADTFFFFFWSNVALFMLLQVFIEQFVCGLLPWGDDHLSASSGSP